MVPNGYYLLHLQGTALFRAGLDPAPPVPENPVKTERK
jgi:hypothetical protein